MDKREIIVATDGSACAADAVRWAADEAALRGVPLRVLSVHESEPPGNTAKETAAQVRPDVEVRPQDVAGSPVPVLMEAAPDAAMLVVGGHGHGGVRSLMLGCVSRQVATRAPGTVAVVRGGDPSGPVVVGCDGTDGCRSAIELGFELAAEHRTRLVAVHAYYPPSPALGFGYQPLVYALDDRDRTVADDVAGELDPWRERYPEVDARVRVVHGSAAGALVAHSRSALAVVIGSHGHGAVAGTLLGSVCPQLLHHARSPVVVTHAAATRW